MCSVTCYITVHMTNSLQLCMVK